MNLDRTFIKAIKEARDFFFPNLCLCCHEIIRGSEKLFCQKCLHYLFLSLPTFSLKGCFHFCEIVVTLDHPLLSSILLKQAREHTKLYQVLASFMVLQLQKVDCSTIDIVMPAISKKRLFSHQPCYFLAKYLAEMFDVPCADMNGKDPIEDKVVLIVDEKLNMDRLEQIGKDLTERNPRMIFAITFLR